MNLRFLDHDGTFKWYTGTDDSGNPLFSADPADARLLIGENAVLRAANLCADHGYDVEIMR